jgi:hypothetical protein
MQISFPISLLGTIEERGDGVLFEGADAQLDMSARPAPGITSAGQLRSLIEQTAGYEDVTYSPSGNRWLVVSGYRGVDIFYEKFVLSDGYVRGFSMQYPASLRRIYDPIVERMEDSFKVGPIVAATGFDREEVDEYPVPPRGEVIRDERIDECQEFGDCRFHDSRAPNAN